MSLADERSCDIDQAAEAFEDAWHRGPRPSILDFLPRTPELRTLALWELVETELELRLKASESAQVEEYVGRFPELTTDEGRLALLIRSEYSLRVRTNPALELATYRDRFPLIYPRLLRLVGQQDGSIARARGLIRLHCPNCGSAIAVDSPEDLSDCRCPDCDTLIDRETVASLTWQPQKLPVIGRFALLDVIGKGTFGTVYKAHDTALDRFVAVKMPRTGSFADQLDEDRFVREGRSMAQLAHPGIVSVFEVSRTSESLPYIVSEFVEGFTLADALADKPLTANQAAEIARQIARALQHAHEHGVVHRDLKPSNVMLQESGTSNVAKGGDQKHGSSTGSSFSAFARNYAEDEVAFHVRVMDFGLARREGVDATMTLEGQIIGTAAYMSPEQAAGQAHRVDGRSDVYSLGVVLFEMLTGERPFRGSRQMLLHHTLNSEPTRLRRLNEKVPIDLETICLRCLEKSPESRFESATLLADELTRFLRGEPILSRPIGTLARGLRWCKRNRMLAASISAALIMLSIIAIGTTASALRINALRVSAEQQREVAERLNAYLLDDVFALADPDRRQGTDLTLLQAIDLAAKSASDRFSDNPIFEATLHEKFGEIYSKVMKPREAIAHLARAKFIRQGILGDEHPDTLRAGRKLAFAHFLASEFELAENEARNILALQNRTLDANDPEIYMMAHTLCLTLWLSYQSTATEEALQWFQRARDHLGPRHHETLALQCVLGGSYIWKGDHVRALPELRESSNVLREEFGFHDRQSIHSTYWYARALVANGNMEEAERLLQEVFEFQKQYWGITHSDAVLTAEELALLYSSQGQTSEAMEVIGQVAANHDTLRRAGATYSATTCVAIAHTLLSMGRNQDAIEFLRTATAVFERTQRYPNAESRAARFELFGLLLRHGRFAEAGQELFALIRSHANPWLGPLFEDRTSADPLNRQ